MRGLSARIQNRFRTGWLPDLVLPSYFPDLVQRTERPTSNFLPPEPPRAWEPVRARRLSGRATRLHSVSPLRPRRDARNPSWLTHLRPERCAYWSRRAV